MRMIRRKTIGEMDRAIAPSAINTHHRSLESARYQSRGGTVRNHALGLAEHVARTRLSD